MTHRGTMARATMIAVLTIAGHLVTGCISFHRPAFAAPASEREWTASLAIARARAADGQYPAADSVLADFAGRHPGSPEALETAYWRGMFKMDPTNPQASLIGGLAALDAYLADPRPRSHVLEATTLRRIGGQLDALNRTVASAIAQAREANTTAANAAARAADANARAADAAKSEPTPSLEAEVKRLKDELAKANAELERIRKRLAQPPVKPPGRL